MPMRRNFSRCPSMSTCTVSPSTTRTTVAFAPSRDTAASSPVQADETAVTLSVTATVRAIR